MSTTNEISDEIKQAVASARRDEAECKRDEGRKPAEVLAFFDVRPGQRVAELNTGRGYFTILLAETVGEGGKVYAHSTEASIKRWKGNPIDARIEDAGFTNIETRVTEHMHEPNLADNLDAVYMIMNYHDSVWVGADRPQLNKNVFDALKPGGVFGVIDHHAAEGMGTEDCDKNHRIEKCICVDEICAAGFELVEESDVLENPDDPLDCGVHGPGMRDHTHRFVLKFKKPG